MPGQISRVKPKRAGVEPAFETFGGSGGQCTTSSSMGECGMQQTPETAENWCRKCSVGPAADSVFRRAVGGSVSRALVTPRPPVM